MNKVKSKLKELTAKDTDENNKKSLTLPEKAGGSTFSKVMDGEYLKTGVSVGVFEQINSSAMIGLGVLVSNINNNAEVIVEGNLNAVNSDIKINSDACDGSIP